MKLSRRSFLGSSATAAVGAGALGAGKGESKVSKDGPSSPDFKPVALQGNVSFSGLAKESLSEDMRKAVTEAPRGLGASWGIPFNVQDPILLKDQPWTEKLDKLKAQWFIFMHTSDLEELKWNQNGFLSQTSGEGRLNEHVADYVIVYTDGSEARQEIRRRHQLGTFNRRWGENCFQAVLHVKPHPLRALWEQGSALSVNGSEQSWAWVQTRVGAIYFPKWANWLWAWENPHPDKEIESFRFEPKTGRVVLSAISAGSSSRQPLRWDRRKKALLTLGEGVEFKPDLDEMGLLQQIQLDMGQVISAEPRKIYPLKDWPNSYNNKLPEVSSQEIIIEYSAHPDARFYLEDGKVIRVSDVQQAKGILQPVSPADQRVTLRVLDKKTRVPVSVKLHIHGEFGEYLPPVDRHRIPNPEWFEDFSPEFEHNGKHYCAYISGETVLNLPVGEVFVEVSKGFEIRPVRTILTVKPGTEQLELEVEKVLPWRERGWVTADTHVHFLSTATAQLEGSAEGVNVVNLLASQWGELMTNVGDFDGRSTFGSKEAGGDGEWLVRVGTENRQNVMGHISLLGYRGNPIVPMTCGGPDEAAIGDPVEVLLMEWAQMCREKGGLVVLPHFPNPRCENAADLITGAIDAVEMTSWTDLYSGIDPYSLSDYYRYLNCGYLIPAVGGTDKMTAKTAVGTVRTYAKIPDDREFSYPNWIDAVKSGHTFVTYGPLLEFAVDGKRPGARISMRTGGGTVDVSWELASVTIPMTKVELIVNGEVRDGKEVDPAEAAGSFSLKVDRSSWVALLVRGAYPDKSEMIAAHTSPVMIDVEGTDFFSAADALSILEQIEGAIAYLDTIGTRAEEAAYKRMRIKLTAAYRKLHNEMHQKGHYHEHNPVTDHDEHKV
jgi:hypothetical protein